VFVKTTIIILCSLDSGKLKSDKDSDEAQVRKILA